MALTAIVLASWFSQPIHGKIYQENIQKQANYSGNEVDKLVSAIRDFSPWDDTVAQWIMMASSIAAAAISWKAVVYVRETLEATREAVKAAQASVDVARENGQTQIRAYITCTGGEICVDDTWCQLAIAFKNKGQSPAIDVSVSGYAVVRPPISINPLFDPLRIDHINGVCELIAAGDDGMIVVIVPHTDMPAKTFEHLLGERGDIGFTFRVAWKDVFDKSHGLTIFLDRIGSKEGDVVDFDITPICEGLHWKAKMKAHNRAK